MLYEIQSVPKTLPAGIHTHKGGAGESVCVCVCETILIRGVVRKVVLTCRGGEEGSSLLRYGCLGSAGTGPAYTPQTPACTLRRCCRRQGTGGKRQEARDRRHKASQWSSGRELSHTHLKYTHTHPQSSGARLDSTVGHKQPQTHIATW